MQINGNILKNIFKIKVEDFSINTHFIADSETELSIVIFTSACSPNEPIIMEYVDMTRYIGDFGLVRKLRVFTNQYTKSQYSGEFALLGVRRKSPIDKRPPAEKTRGRFHKQT